MKLKKLLQEVSVIKMLGNDELNINNIDFDSRKIQSGHLFVAMRGKLLMVMIL